MASVEPIGPRGTGRRYRVRWRTPEGDHRKQTFRLREDADRWARDVEAAKDRGGYVDPSLGHIRFKSYAEQWRRAQLQHRPSTVEQLDHYLPRHVYPHLGGQYLTSIARSTIQGWVEGIALALKPSTADMLYRWVATIFAAAVEDGMLARSPCRKINLPEVVDTPIIPIATEGVAALLDVVPHRYRAVIGLGAGAGPRQGEALGLTVDRVDWLRRTIRVDRQLVTRNNGATVIQSQPKTLASNRVIPVSASVLDELAAHIARYGTVTAAGEDGAPVEGLIFHNRAGHPVQRSPFAAIMRRAVAKAKLPTGTTFHDLRHFYASALIAKGCSVKVVQARLGHKSAVTTLDLYGHLWPDDDETTRAAIEDILGPVLRAPAPKLRHGTPNGTRRAGGTR